MTFSKTQASGAILLIWIMLCALAFWWFQAKHTSRFGEHFVAFHGESLKSIVFDSVDGRATVLHLVDADCPCSAWAERHISDLERNFADEVRFMRFADLPKGISNALSEAGIPATPAVVIWSKDGELKYFGPYSSGAFCGQGDDFVSSTLEHIESQDLPSWLNHDVLGCFCPRSKTEGVQYE